MTNLHSPVAIAGLVIGLTLVVVGVIARGYVRRRLSDAGVNLTSYVVVEDDLYYTELYLKMARAHKFPRWPPVVSILGIFLGFLAAFAGMLFGR